MSTAPGPATVADAAEVLARCDELATLTATPPALERTHLTAEHAAANARVAGWLRQAGLRTWQDAGGNVWGRVEGAEPGLPALVLGSHLDTVPDAGRYDGMLGVVMAVAVVDRLVRDGRAARLPVALEVVGFGDEEGTRFGTALLGSRAVAGQWDEQLWERRDADGVSVREAATAFGLDPDRIGEAARRPEDLVAYLEAHIEQGPRLEAADRSLGYVTAIAGARRGRLTVHGEARHAGGTPYERRRDALVGAAEVVVAVERVARAAGAIATVGRLEVHPGAVNVVPGRVDLSLDVRAETDALRDRVWQDVHAEAEAVCDRRGLRLEHVLQHEAAATPCSPWLQAVVRDAVRGTGDDDPAGLWSPAGHDAMSMAAVTDVGMLFVRCADGISHHPGESVRADDVAAGLDAFEAAVLAVAHADRAPVA